MVTDRYQPQSRESSEHWAVSTRYGGSFSVVLFCSLYSIRLLLSDSHIFPLVSDQTASTPTTRLLHPVKLATDSIYIDSVFSLLN